MWAQEHFVLEESSQIGEIRRAAVVLCKDLSFPELVCGRIAIVINELATNVLKHATRGEMILANTGSSLEILALDKGQGISDVMESMRDGVSTSGTAGNGLGALKRLTNQFDLYTQAGKGTVLHASFFAEGKVGVDYMGAINRPYPGERVSGDAWAIKNNGKDITVLMVDGLGHGLHAFDASQIALKVFREREGTSSIDYIHAMNTALRASRGAAAAVAHVDLSKSIVSYCGVGNTVGALVAGGETKRMISYGGTLGLQIGKPKELPYRLQNDTLLIMHSDGLGTHWSLEDYVGLKNKHPLLVAAVLYRDHQRKNDDAGVVVVRCGL